MGNGSQPKSIYMCDQSYFTINIWTAHLVGGADAVAEGTERKPNAFFSIACCAKFTCPLTNNSVRHRYWTFCCAFCIRRATICQHTHTHTPLRRCYFSTWKYVLYINAVQFAAFVIWNSNRLNSNRWIEGGRPGTILNESAQCAVRVCEPNTSALMMIKK